MTHYTDSHMMQDYLFLSSLSRATAEAGRKIASLNLLSPTTSSSTSSSTHDTAKHTPQQRQRDQLIKQLHYRRFRVMVLPEGMARRMANQTNFARGKLSISVEVKFPNEGGGRMVHKQLPTSTVESIVLGELQRRSFTNPKELSRLRSASCSSKTTSTAWFVSPSIIEQLHLPDPATASKVDDGKAVLLNTWPTEWTVLVPIYSARLTNESTTRYLDWWSRKRKWEESHPGLTWVGREERQAQRRVGGGEGAQDEGWSAKRKRVSGWGRERGEEGDVVFDGAQSGSGPVEQVTIESGAQQGPPASIEGGQAIVSSSLLTMLSQRLGRNLAPETALSGVPSVPAPSSVASPSSSFNPNGTAAATTANSTANPTDPKNNTRSSTSPSTTATANTNTATSLSLSLLHPSRTTLGHLLTDLPEGYGVVEFPEFRVVSADSTDAADTVAFASEAVAPDQEVQRPEHGPDVKRGARKSETTAGSLQGLLAGYASDSDNDDQQDEQRTSDTQQPAAIQDRAATSLASIASRHGFTHLPPCAT